MLSCFNDVYEYVGSCQSDRLGNVPPNILDEIALNIAFAPFWILDLTRTWMDIIPGSDASESYGFGVCVASAAP